MLRYALRRVLWAIPTLLVTSVVLFLVTTLAPDPAGSDDPIVEEARRERFADLPRFFNMRPEDVASRATAATGHVAANDAEAPRSARELAELGGAALPFVLPSLESLAPDARGRVATALAPIAERMGLDAPGHGLRSPESAVPFWSHLWEDRALDFTRTAVGRGVARLVEHGSDAREQDLAGLDTYALPEILGAMTTAKDPVTLARLTRLAQHATGRGPVVTEESTPDDLRRTVANWREWWFVHGTDFLALDGAERAIASVTETRYGKWLRRAASGELGVSVIDGEPIAAKLEARAPLTLLTCGLAMLLSWTLAVPIGALGAWRQGRPFDVVSSGILFVLYATPTFAVAELLRRVAGDSGSDTTRVAMAVVALAAGSVATLSRWQRAAMLDLVRQDFVRSARARGLSAWRVAVWHVLRNALMPTVTLAGLHLPVLLGGAFVVEEVFGLRGVGFETLRAIAGHDIPWLMAIMLASAVTVTAGLVASDVVCGALDPRVRETLTGRLGGRDA